MKVGTLAEHQWWGKCLVIESLFHFYGERLPLVVRVHWIKPATTAVGARSTMRIYEEDLAILSEPEV